MLTSLIPLNTRVHVGLQFIWQVNISWVVNKPRGAKWLDQVKTMCDSGSDTDRSIGAIQLRTMMENKHK